MDNYFQKIYDLIYSPVTTPYNLLENAKLENYSYVKYYKEAAGLVAEMKCTIEDEGEAIFYYHFDANNKLLKVLMRQESVEEVVFDRKNELECLKNKYIEKHSKSDTLAM